MSLYCNNLRALNSIVQNKGSQHFFLSRGYYHESVVTIFGVLVAQKRERRGKGGVGRAPLQKSIRGGGSVFFRILHRKIPELLFIETVRNYRKTFFGISSV